MTRTQIYLSEDQKRALRHLAAARGRSNVSDLVREAVDRLLASEGIDWGARFDAFRRGIESSSEDVTEEDFEAADAAVRAARRTTELV